MNEIIAQYLTSGSLDSFIVFESVLILVVLSNWLVLRRAGRHPQPEKHPSVSFLVPARNEEDNIRTCLLSLLSQDYPDFEVIVLDDQSEDGTSREINRLKGEFLELKVIVGESLPGGWLGKNWACNQLFESAQGEILFFTDADTVHAPDMLKKVVSSIQGEQADLITGVPQQILGSWSEKLLVPLFPWAFYTFNPLLLAYAIRFPELSAAVGQLMVFRREAYHKIGGHAGVRTSMVEDLELARRIKENGLRWRVMDISKMISCRMYRNSGEVFQGLAKNLFPAFEHRILVFLFVWFWLAFLFLEPVILILLGLFGVAIPPEAISKALICVFLAWFIWAFVFSRLRLPVGLGFFYPILIGGFEAMAFSSFWLTVRGRTTWKGRTIQPPRLRL
jgi:chlorobactene glucosyltransferase